MSKVLFMSASIPNPNQPKYLAWGAYPRAIEEAVTSLTRLCLQRNITLVFGGHPSISPLVALIALERRGFTSDGEPPIRIYQSEAYRGKLPDKTWALFRAGVAHIVWTDRVEGDQAPFPESLKLMRERMLDETQPGSMVCIGGMQGIPDELALYRARFPTRPVYVLAETGGASMMLAHSKLDGIAVVESSVSKPSAHGTEPNIPQPYPYLLSKMLDKMF